MAMQALADVLANATDTESHEAPEQTVTNLQPNSQPAPNPRECFVGEIVIVGSSSTYSTEVVVKDKEDTDLRVGFAFPPDGYGYEGVPTEFLKRGLTMLILYPSRTQLDGGGDLIVVHNPKHIKILPFRMPFYLRLCERVTEFRSVVGRQRICFGCETRKYG
ncbi:hypothetical protein ASPVEDRAFT_69380, partial [Aspergillus versicolor CBS 583.65]